MSDLHRAIVLALAGEDVRKSRGLTLDDFIAPGHVVKSIAPVGGIRFKRDGNRLAIEGEGVYVRKDRHFVKVLDAKGEPVVKTAAGAGRRGEGDWDDQPQHHSSKQPRHPATGPLPAAPLLLSSRQAATDSLGRMSGALRTEEVSPAMERRTHTAHMGPPVNQRRRRRWKQLRQRVRRVAP